MTHFEKDDSEAVDVDFIVVVGVCNKINPYNSDTIEIIIKIVRINQFENLQHLPFQELYII